MRKPARNFVNIFLSPSSKLTNSRAENLEISLFFSVSGSIRQTFAFAVIPAVSAESLKFINI
jgi:hypothetical protein